MADTEGGGTKFLRGLLIAGVLVAALVLGIVFRDQVADTVSNSWDYVKDRFPDKSNQRAAVLVYLVIAVLFGVFFSKAGHFTAFGIGLALGPLLWFLFWEGFPPLGLNPTWTDSLNVDHLPPAEVITWAIVGAAIITLVFVPLELREKYLRRKHSLADED